MGVPMAVLITEDACSTAILVAQVTTCPTEWITEWTTEWTECTTEWTDSLQKHCVKTDMD